MSRPLWTVATASSLGGSHRASGAPNQDAVASFETDRGLCVAIADGHGGPRYVRSHDGSRIAVAVARQLCGDALRDGRPLVSIAAELPPAIVGEWRRRVAADLAERPLSSAEVTAVGADPLVAYGATLLLVLVREDEAVALQLGDGDIVTAWPDGEVRKPMPDDPRNVGGQTTSLCLSDAASSFRMMPLDRRSEPPALVLLGSDGYGNSFADPYWHERVLTDVLDQRRRDGVESVAERLPRWTAESARVGGDDTTVAVVFHVADASARPVPAAPPLAAPVADSSARPIRDPSPVTATSVLAPAAARPEATTVDRPEGRRGPALLPIVGLVVAACIVGLIVGWAAGGRGGDAVEPTDLGSSPTSTADPTVPTTTPAVPTTAPVTTASRPASTGVPPSRSVVPVQPTDTQPASSSADERAVDGTVLVNAGWAVVAVDVLADPFAPQLEDPQLGTPILDLITPVGRWWVADGQLNLQRAGVFAAPEILPDATDDSSAWGLAFSAGRVVVVWAEPGELAQTATVDLYDGVTGDRLERTTVRADEPSGAESDNPIPSEQEEGSL